MKLYYTPGACSQAPHIALREAGLDFTLDKVDLRAKTTESGQDFKKANPKGYVPALETEPGVVMSEVSVLLQYVADQAPASKLAPSPASAERYALQTWLTFISTEIHKGFGMLFKPQLGDDVKEIVRQFPAPRLDYLQSELSKRDYLMESGYSVADIYLFVVTGWAPKIGIDLAKWPAIAAFRERIAQRPAVQAALKAEGLLG